MTEKFLNHNNLINTMKRIKQLLTITAISLCCSISNAQPDNRLYLTLENIEHSTEAKLMLCLDNPSVELTATEGYIKLPEGCSSITNGNLNRDVCTASHKLTQGWVGELFYISIASSTVETFTNKGSILCTWKIDLSALVSGCYTIECNGLFAVGADTYGNINTYTTNNQQLSFTIDDKSTSISDINTQTGTLHIYDLHGVEQSHLTNGKINIINGKKIFVK